VEKDPLLWGALIRLTAPAMRYRLGTPLRWTCKTNRQLAEELQRQNHAASERTVAKLLKELGLSQRASTKALKRSSYVDRDKQFRRINSSAINCRETAQPVVFVDIKEPELDWVWRNDTVGWQLKGKARTLPDEQVGRAFFKEPSSSGVDKGWLAVGISRDTAKYAVAGIHHWCSDMNIKRSDEVFKLMIVVCAGAADLNRNRWWNEGLQDVANDTRLTLRIHHFPHGRSKCNSVHGHRVYLITTDWRGFPMVKYAVVVTKVAAMMENDLPAEYSRIDTTEVETGIDFTRKRPARGACATTPGEPMEQWNYSIYPEE
jgi:hypothetical protein